MAWTTSAHPWANGSATGAVVRAAGSLRTLRHMRLKLSRAAFVRSLAGAHMVGLAILVDGDSLNPFLLLTGAALMLALLAVPGVNLKDRPAAPAAPDIAAISDVGAKGPGLEAVELDARTRAELMARISHELRTPLNAIIGFSDLMGGELFGPMGHPRYREYVGHIRDSGRDLLRSAEDTLAITSLLARTGDDDNRQPLALQPLIREAWVQAAPGLAARDTLRLDTTGVADVEVLGDRRGLRQTITNLMSEAARRANDGAAVTLEARAVGGAVRLSIQVESQAANRDLRSTSLPACLARTMLELQGASLVESVANGVWTATIDLDQAMQSELFAA